MNGRCVKLVQGKPGSGIKISNYPIAVAKFWEINGAKILHVIDLDAAIYGSEKNNRSVIVEILKNVSIPVQVGGGIRSITDVALFLNAGAKWVILGTAAVENLSFVKEVVEMVNPKRIINALDTRECYPVKEGWKTKVKVTPYQLAKMFESLDVAAYLFTDVDIEGTMKGVNVENVKKLVESTKIPIIYAGGISSLQDIVKLLKIGVAGVVVGRALYEGVFSLKEAMELVKNAGS